MAQSDLIAELCQRAEEAAESIRSDARAEADRLMEQVEAEWLELGEQLENG